MRIFTEKLSNNFAKKKK